MEAAWVKIKETSLEKIGVHERPQNPAEGVGVQPVYSPGLAPRDFFLFSFL
jgi:hypothetical protein